MNTQQMLTAYEHCDALEEQIRETESDITMNSCLGHYPCMIALLHHWSRVRNNPKAKACLS